MFEKTFCHWLLALTLLCSAGNSAAGELQDPTRPARSAGATVVAPVVRFAVSAIFVSDNRRVAVLNGQTVVAGDRVDGATVHSINAHTVELRYRGETIKARLDLARVRE